MEKQQITAKLNQVMLRQPELQLKQPLNWTIRQGEHWAVAGTNGAGKTRIAEILQGRYLLESGSCHYYFDGLVSEQIQSISFKDIYSLADCRNSYYQQRWHATETDDSPTVASLLDYASLDDELKEQFGQLQIEESLAKKLIFLSSGELRKFLIIRKLLKHPRLLILDNPFIGLDADSRQLLNELLQQLSKLNGLQTILLLANPQDIPDWITHVLPVHDLLPEKAVTRTGFLSDSVLLNRMFHALEAESEIKWRTDSIHSLPVLPEPAVKPDSIHQITFRMEDVNIRYGKRTILKAVNWEVRNGEKWALTGCNGSGKSTLLSLLYADNPQAYANSLWLFDRKRGSGESIWDIKQRIGFISPEMHLYYQKNVPAIRIVASGFFDSVGLYRQCSEAQQAVALQWMETFGIAHLQSRLFFSLSSGEQRLVLLARAFVKDPDLLILDEPLHGLDLNNKRKVAAIIDAFCKRENKTMIYVTHYLQELPACISRTYHLNKQT